MNNRWNRFLSLLLALCTVLTMIPAAFALETTEELPQDPGTGEEEVVAVEDIDAEAGIMPAATFVPDGSSDTEYPAITVTGTSHGSKAAELLDLLNEERAANASSILIPTVTGTQTAAAMAAEYIYGSDIIRATGEDWSTLAGDKELAINEGTSPLLVFAVTDEADAEVAMENLSINYPELLEGNSFNNAGIGCFELTDGSVYWAILLYNGTEFKAADAAADEAVSYPVPFDPEDINAYMDLALDRTELNMGESFVLNAVLNNGTDEIVIPASALTYTSSDEKVITIAKDGTLTAVGSGEALVTVTMTDADSLTASVELSSALNLVAPTLKSISNAAKGVQITWEEVPGATHYYVYRSSKASTWGQGYGTKIKTVSAGTTSYVDTTAAAGKTWYYTVRSVYSGGSTPVEGDLDTTGKGIYYIPLPTPTSAKSSADGITVSWNKVTGAGGYAIYRKVNNKGTWAWLANASSGSSSYIDTDVTKGNTYSYTIRGYKGSTKSAYSNAGVSTTASATVKFNSYVVRSDVKYRTGAGTNYTAVGTLKAGTNIKVFAGWSKKANNATWFKFSMNGKIYYVMSQYLMGQPVLKNVENHANGAKVTWNAVANAGGYAIYRRAPGQAWGWVANVKSGVTSYIDPDKNLTSGTKYSYTVRAYYGSVRSPYDNTGVSLTYIKTPSLVSATAGDKQIVFKWNSVPNAESYRVYRRINGGAWKQAAIISDPSVTSYTDTNVSSLTEYGYTVRAYVGTTRSSYVTNYVAAVLSSSSDITTATLTADTKYRTGAGTNYSASGTLKSGKVVNAFATDLSSTSTTWTRVLISNTRGVFIRYLPKSSLLLTPQMKATQITANGVKVTWGSVSGATAYEVWRRVPGKSWIKLANVSGSTTTYQDNTVGSGSTYAYTVRANKGTVRSSFEPAGISVLYLSTPTLLTAVASDKAPNKGIKISWNAVPGAAGYRVYRRVTGSGSSWEWIKTTTATSYLDDGINGNKKEIGLVKGVTYSYTVRAYSGNYTSSYNGNGISATAVTTQYLPVTKYTVKVTSAPYYKLDASGQVLASGVQSTTLKKGDVIEVLSGLPVVEDTYSTGVTYTPFQKGDAVYYIRTSYIEKA